VTALSTVSSSENENQAGVFSITEKRRCRLLSPFHHLTIRDLATNRTGLEDQWSSLPRMSIYFPYRASRLRAILIALQRTFGGV